MYDFTAYDFTAYDLHLPKFIKTSVDSPFNAVVIVAAPILNELELNPFKFHLFNLFYATSI